MGDSGLDDLLGANLTRDAAVLEFDVTSPASRNLTFHYIFASEEYPEFSSTQFTDIMAIFIDGVNVATIPGTSLPVTVNYLNGGWARQGGDVPATNPQYYQDNHDPENTALPAYAVSTPVYDLQYDGTTLLLTAQASISGNVAHHIRIAIADVSDQGLDSAVFISAEVPCP